MGHVEFKLRGFVEDLFKKQLNSSIPDLLPPSQVTVSLNAGKTWAFFILEREKWTGSGLKTKVLCVQLGLRPSLHIKC